MNSEDIEKSYRNEYYFDIVDIIFCFKNKEDYFIIIIINFHVRLQAACVLDQK